MTNPLSILRPHLVVHSFKLLIIPFYNLGGNAQQGRENTEPLPNPWGNNSAPTTNTSSSGTDTTTTGTAGSGSG